MRFSKLLVVAASAASVAAAPVVAVVTVVQDYTVSYTDWTTVYETVTCTDSAGDLTTLVSTLVGPASDLSTPVVAVPTVTASVAASTSAPAATILPVSLWNSTFASSLSLLETSKVSTKASTKASTSQSPSSVPLSSHTAPLSSQSAPSLVASAAPPPPPAPPSELDSIFTPIDTSLPALFPQQPLDLPLPGGVSVTTPLQTNKFHSNYIIDGQQYAAYTDPYTVWQSTEADFVGMAVSHVTFDQRVFDTTKSPPEYYINPVGIMYIVYSAQEFAATSPSFGVTAMDAFSASVTLSGSGTLSLPVVQGMGFVTASYDGLTPQLRSQVGFASLQKLPTLANGVQKYAVGLNGGLSWVLYVSGSCPDLTLTNGVISAPAVVHGVVMQMAVLNGGSSGSPSNSVVDAAAGMYPVSASIDGSASGSQAQYTISYQVQGQSTGGTTFLWALPHHLQSATSALSSAVVSGLTADSTTKGVMTAVLTNSLTMAESLATDMQFMPYSSQSGFVQGQFDAEALKLIASTAQAELSAADMVGEVSVSSTYTAGKAIDKFAYMVWVAHAVLNDQDLVATYLPKLQEAFAVFGTNSQPIPLIYDTLYKGVTSSGAQNGGDPNTDYGSPLYNDHHFHYGYWVHAAALIAEIDGAVGSGTWLAKNRDFVNSLVRDVANPSSQDPHFPVSRMFDWFSGHSWASGLFGSAAGRNEESTSEDVNFAYGMKLWGKVSGDANMEARGNLMLAVLHRSLTAYFLMQDDNANQPSQMIPNRVTGITFQNQIDHTTYFGTNLEYIQGIQMIPITPASGLTREPTFVQQEWEGLLAPIFGSLDSGWAGILASNQALFDPASAYSFFSQPGFSSELLDGGASLTWYLTLAAGLKGGL